MTGSPSAGRLTSLNPFPGATLVGSELMFLVSPGNAPQGVNYRVTTQILSNLLIGLTTTPTFVTSGATYNSVPTDIRILVNKTVGSATSIVLASSTGYALPVLVKDLKGDAGTNTITVTFSGGQTADGLSSVPINTDYGSYWFNPLAAGGWYLTGT